MQAKSRTYYWLVHAAIALCVGLAVLSVTVIIVLQRMTFASSADRSGLAKRISSHDIIAYVRTTNPQALFSPLIQPIVTIDQRNIPSGSGSYELAILGTTGTGTVAPSGWILFFTPEDPTSKPMRVLSDPSAAAAMLSSADESRTTLADTREFRGFMDTSAPHVMLLATNMLATTNTNHSTLMRAVLSPYDFVVASWDGQGSGKATFIRTTSVGAKGGLPSNWQPASPTPSIVIEDRSLADRFAQLASLLSEEHRNLFEGLRGIALQRWQQAMGGRKTPAQLLLPLLERPARLDVELSADTVAFALQGSTDTPKLVGQLIEEYMLQTPSATVRRIALNDHERIDVIAETQATGKEKTIANSWSVTSSRAGSGHALFVATQGQKFVLANSKPMVDRAIGVAIQTTPGENVSARGQVDIQALQSLLQQYAPFLLSQSESPWSLLQGKKTIRWSIAERSDAVVVEWKTR